VIAPNTDNIKRLIEDIRDVLTEIERDYPRAHDEAYGLTRKGGESGRTGHSDPTGETALAREPMKWTCVRVSRRLAAVRQQIDGIGADLDSSLRQSDDPHAREVRAEMADQARIVTKEEQRAIQAKRDHDMNAALQGRASARKRRRILEGWRNLSDKVAT
jgi:hypothetical protein